MRTRHLLPFAMLLGCGSVDASPLGGPYGGQTDPTDPNAGKGPANTDSGVQASTDASGGPSGKDASSAPDASAPPPTVDAGGPPPPMAPTWSDLFKSYLASGTEGRCSDCHSEGSSATKLYSWLSGKGYISGASSSLVSTSSSCLSWYGGNMPPSGPSDATAVSDMNAWAAAGANDN